MKIEVKQIYQPPFYATTAYKVSVVTKFSKSSAELFLGWVYSIYRDGEKSWFYRHDDFNVFGESLNKKAAIKNLLSVPVIKTLLGK